MNFFGKSLFGQTVFAKIMNREIGQTLGNPLGEGSGAFMALRTVGHSIRAVEVSVRLALMFGNLAVHFAIRCLLRLPSELAVLILMVLPPAIYALPAAWWWGLTNYSVAYVVFLLAWVIFLVTRSEAQ